MASSLSCGRRPISASLAQVFRWSAAAAPAAAPAAAAAATAADKKSKRTLKGNDHRSFISSDSPEAAYLCVFFACPFFPVVPTPSTDPFSLSDPFAGRVPLKEKFRVAP